MGMLVAALTTTLLLDRTLGDSGHAQGSFIWLDTERYKGYNTDMTVRVELRFTEKQAEMLDRIAEQVGKALAPQHAIRSGHKYNRKAAILFLLEQYGAEHETAECDPQGIYTEDPDASGDSVCHS